MAVGYPPQPVYPNGIDSDYTLFLVYNTTEAALDEDNDPWAEEITIVARGKTQSEIWADNGFANINGELLYYDSVDKDANGKVYKLKRCARNLGDVPTQFNAIGTMVRGFVVAEHHNQLVDAVILNEQFIGFNFTTDKSTLDWRIRNLQAVPIIFDDFGCPDITFHFTEVSSDPSSGTVVNYSLDVVGSFNEFTLNFGDGSSTSSVQSGTHTYAPNANIDPVVIFKNQNCQIVQTPPQRDSVNAPQSQTTPTSYSVPNSPTFVFPNINVQSPSFPEPNITLPPFQFPCIDLSPLGISPINIPSVIMFIPDINLPSMIEFEDINIPSLINFNLPSILNISIPDINIIVPDIPNISLIVPDISIPPLVIPNISVVFPNISGISLIIPEIPPISVAVPNFPSISVVFPNLTISAPNISLIVPTLPNISLVVPTLPNISVTWNEPPVVSVAFPTAPNISVIWGSPPNVSLVWGTPPTVPVSWTQPPQVTVSFTEPPVISVNWNPVPTVNVNWGTPPLVSVVWGTPPNVSMAWGSPPQVTVNWGTPPTVQVNVTITCPSTPLALAAADTLNSDDMLGVGKDLQVEYDITGFPSEIKLIPPEIPDVRIIHDLPSEIIVRSPTFPELKLEVPEFRDIKILPPETQLTIETIGIPEVIRLESTFSIPERIELFMPVRLPDRIIIEHDIPEVIRVEGLPDVIRLEHNLPATIKLEMPDKPEIEMVYKGSPIPVQIQLDIQKLIGDQEGLQCVAIVPCPRR